MDESRFSAAEVSRLAGVLAGPDLEDREALRAAIAACAGSARFDEKAERHWAVIDALAAAGEQAGFTAYREWRLSEVRADGRDGYVDLVLVRDDVALAIEVDSAPREKSILKLLAAADRLGHRPVWVCYARDRDRLEGRLRRHDPDGRILVVRLGRAGHSDEVFAAAKALAETAARAATPLPVLAPTEAQVQAVIRRMASVGLDRVPDAWKGWDTDARRCGALIGWLSRQPAGATSSWRPPNWRPRA